MSKKSIGIITWHYYHNYGSVLQAYALQKTINDMGYKAQIINYRNKKYGNYSKAKQFFQRVVHVIFKRFRNENLHYSYPFSYFISKYLKETKLVQEEEKLKSLCKKFKVVICGSDQIWAPNVLNSVYLLEYIPDEVRRVAYAASIGLNIIPNDLVIVYKENLSKFQSISVREEIGSSILKNTCGIDAEVVLDPTFLIKNSEWSALEIPPKTLKKKKYIFCYFLNNNHNYKESIIEYAQENNLDILGVSANENDYSWMINSRNVGPGEFLWLIHNAEMIVTDSYHGTIFSLLYHKKFLTIERFQASDEDNQNSRIYQLKKYFELTNQIQNSKSLNLYDLKAIDYERFEKRLMELRTLSFAFLKENLR